jgi:hypothetical protein
MRGLAIHVLLIASSLSATAQQPVKPSEPLPPIPATSAVLIVAVPTTGVTATEADLIVQRRVATHIATLRSEQHLRKVLSDINGKARKTQWFTSAENPLERATWLRDHLRATAVPGTPLIEVSLPDVKDAAERRTILEEICTAYIERARQIAVDELSDRTTILNNTRIKAEMRKKDLDSEMREKQIRLATDGGTVQPGRVGVKELELSKLVGEQVDAQVELTRARTAYETIVNAAARKVVPEPIAERVRHEPRLVELQRRLDDAETRLAVAQSNKPESALTELKAEIEHLRKRADALSIEMTTRALAAATAEAKARLDEAKVRYEFLSGKVDFLKADVGELSNAMVAYFNLQEESRGLREQVRAVKARIEETMSAQTAPMAVDIRWHIMPEEGR